MASRPDDISRPRRQTFAFEVQAPAQAPLDRGGGPSYRGAEIVGGRTISGDASPAGQNPVNFGAQLGGFFDNLLKPYAERKARENFIKGMTDQMYAEAGQEIRAGDGFLTQVFGPTAYEEGAIFYEARNRVAKAQSEWAADEDELKKLPPQEVAKAWAQKLEQSKTGDPFTDDAIESSLLEASGPMLQTVAKARYSWQQETTVKNQQMAWGSSATAFQQQAASFAKTSSPTDEDVLGFETAVNNFLAGMQQPAGQDDESYRKSISSSFRRMIQDGNGHAASALMRRGILDILSPEERIRAEDQYLKYGKISTGNAAASFVDDINVLQGKLAFGELDGITAVKEARLINEKIKRATGFDLDYFDTDDQESILKGVWSAAKSAADKLDERQWQMEREDIRDQRADEREMLKAQVEASSAEAAYASDSPGSAMVAGAVKDDTMQARLYAGYQDNDFPGLSRSYKDGLTSSNVKTAITNTVNSAIYTGYSPEFEGLHGKFEGMLKQNPAMAKEYFGNQNWAAMLNYRKLLSGGASKQAAFTQAFGDDIQYSPDGSQVSAARKDIREWVAENAQPGRLSRIFNGEYKLNSSGIGELANMIGREVAVDGKFGGAALSNETLMTTALARARNNGQFEKYGPLGWSNRPGTKPLYALLGYTAGNRQQGEEIITAVINRRLKDVGFSEGAYADEYSIVRGKFNGQDTLLVVPVEDGVLTHRKGVVITLDQFKKADARFRKLKTAPGAKPAPTQPQLGAQLREAQGQLSYWQNYKPSEAFSNQRKVTETQKWAAEVKRLRGLMK